MLTVVFFLTGCDHIPTIAGVKKEGIGARGLHLALYRTYSGQCKQTRACDGYLYTIDISKSNPACSYWPKAAEEIFGAEFGGHGVLWHSNKTYSYNELTALLDYHFSVIGNGYSYQLIDDYRGYAFNYSEDYKTMTIVFKGEGLLPRQRYTCDEIKYAMKYQKKTPVIRY